MDRSDQGGHASNGMRSGRAGGPVATCLAITLLVVGGARASEVEEAGAAPPMPTSETASEPTPRSATPAAISTTPEGLPGVAHATFTSDVVEREPVDSVTFLDNDTDRILFFTDLRNLAGHTVEHRWEHDGTVVASVPFDVGGNRWRVWSSKTLRPDWLGEWRVSVVDQNDVVLETRTFTYSDSGAPRSLTP